MASHRLAYPKLCGAVRKQVPEKLVVIGGGVSCPEAYHAMLQMSTFQSYVSTIPKNGLLHVPESTPQPCVVDTGNNQGHWTGVGLCIRAPGFQGHRFLAIIKNPLHMI